ncbi:MAG: hybrid sensor histidine kinase/response regulator [Alphaproteobacteria bacterium]|nr:hybrid sensor histidine kinase/response regulator [Alphaproteobacteria bacterium]MBV9555081.1 hybrid sensor histidine kinase/response regulator [Alphaproteobacteria bacterium]
MSETRGQYEVNERSLNGRPRPLILLVDDDQIERLVGREYFGSIGFDVCDLGSGRECLQQAGMLLPDLIILDVMMPGIDGFEVCRRLRADVDLAYTPILMATSLDDENSIEKAFEVGATDFVTKPIAWSLLGHRVKFVLRMSEVERKLRDTTRLAEAANRAKSNFLTNMSHELRTPLNAIIGFSETMRGELLGPLGDKRYADYANDIYQSGTHLLQLVNTMLDLSKVDAGMMELNEDIVAVDAVVRAAMALVQDKAAKHDITVSLSAPPPPPLVLADEFRLKQILINLLSNAVKFTPDNGEVAVRIERTPAGEIACIIRDSGIGMAPEDLPRIKESFVQLDDPTSKRYDGTGLGVPLAIALAQLHGGSIGYESEVGVGTTATLTLPPERVVEESGFGPPRATAIPGTGQGRIAAA